MIKVLGIDPDLKKPGLCFMHDGKIHNLLSEDMDYLINSLRYYMSHEKYIVALEDVNKVKPIYAKHRKGSVAVQTKIAQNVGMVKAAATILTDYARFHGKDVILVPPGIGKQTKRNAKLFAELTGYKGSTNEDTRDAYWIAKYAYNKLKNGEL